MGLRVAGDGDVFLIAGQVAIGQRDDVAMVNRFLAHLKGRNFARATRRAYAYDVLNNLVTVTQGGQTRRFAYDSLSRLIYAANPEQTTSSGLVFNSQQWAIKYDYDLNSNLIAKTLGLGKSDES